MLGDSGGRGIGSAARMEAKVASVLQGKANARREEMTVCFLCGHRDSPIYGASARIS